jgi:UDP-glucose 4-epimerase
MKNILVTGGAGYIGSHTARALSDAGYHVLILDNLSTGKRELIIPEADFFELDLCNAKEVEQFFAEHEIDAVMHFAALSSVGESVEKPELYQENNIQGTLNLLNSMEKNKVRKLIFSSTAAVYGEPEEMPITEETAPSPVNPYGETKLAMEQEMQKRAKEKKLDFVALRYFNVAGASLDCELGEMRENETHLIPLVFERALSGKSISIFGTDYPTPDGTCVRDYVHVLDIAQGHLRALDYLNDKKGGHVFNLGSGYGFSVREIIQVCQWVSELNFEIVEEERRAGDPPRLLASHALAKKELKWQPEYSLEEIIRSAWNWFNTGK